MSTTVLVVRFSAPTVVLQRVTYGQTPPDREAIKAAAVKNAGGVPSDYAILHVTDETTVERISRGDDFTITWDGVNELAEPTVNFSTEDNKRILRVTSSAAVVQANGAASVTLTFELRRQDNGQIDTTITENRFVSATKPNGQNIAIRLAFTNGVATINFKAAAEDAGEWRFPGADRPGQGMKTTPQSFTSVFAFITAF